jgi:hypothetical protein
VERRKEADRMEIHTSFFDATDPKSSGRAIDRSIEWCVRHLAVHDWSF